MKNTHRQAIGLELFFSTRSSFFSGMNECTQTDVDELVFGSSATARMSVAADMRKALKDLAGTGCVPAGLVPENILLLADCPLRECFSKESLRTFFIWLIDLARHNESDRVARVSALNTAASHLDGQTASFVRTGFALNNQRVVIRREEDSLVVSYAERDWGRVRVRFDGCCFPDGFPDCCIPGYAFSIEADEIDGGFEFRFLVDTRFSDNDYCLRLMQPMGWHEFSFTCRTLTSEITACDYAGRLERLGTPRAELVDRVCASLLSKHEILGSGGLSPEEQSMLPAAELIAGCGGLLTAPKDQRWKSEQKILDALDNRYAMSRMAQLLTDSNCPELARQFEQCRSARYDDNDSAAIRSTRLYAGSYELHIADGRARPLIRELSGRLCAMTSAYTGSTSRTLAEDAVLSHVSKIVEPCLSALNFEGNYPHFIREGKRRTDYLSVMLLPASDIPRRGVYSYYVSLSAAQLNSPRKEALLPDTSDRSRSNALDCQPELNSVSRYGELASADDGIVIRVDSDSSGIRREIADDSPQLEHYVRIADCQFRRGSLPAGYALQRLLHSAQPSSALRILLSSLPVCAVFSLALLLAYLVFCEALALPSLTPLHAFGAAAVLCSVLTLLLVLLRRLRHAFTLWRYR